MCRLTDKPENVLERARKNGHENLIYTIFALNMRFKTSKISCLESNNYKPIYIYIIYGDSTLEH